MVHNNFRIAIRNLLKHKIISAINIFGLAIGLGCCILILLYVGDELSFDTFHQHADRIYRVVLSYQKDGTEHFTDTPAPLKAALQTEYPELHDICRVGGDSRHWVVVYKHKQIRNQTVLRVDENFLDIFSFPLASGSKENALREINSVVISPSMAVALFADENPVGKLIKIGSLSRQTEYQVSGVLEKIPANSRFQMDALIPFKGYYVQGNEGNVSWGALNYTTYMRIPETFNPERITSASRKFWQKYRGKEIGGDMDLYLQPLREVHVSLSPGYPLPTDRNGSHIYLFLAVALLILVIASINYTNLTIARYMERHKEVAMRKVVGAKRGQLVQQFLSESLVLTVMAMAMAVLLAEIFLPLFNQYTGKLLYLSSLFECKYLIGYLILSLVVGVMAGSYPAFYISSLPVFNILKGGRRSRKAGPKAGLKKGLVFLQFAISLVFIASTLIIHKQLDFIQNRELGYNSAHVLVVPIHQLGVRERYRIYKTEILSHAGVAGVSAANYLPAKRSYYQNVYFEGEDQGKLHYISWIPVDADFIETMKIKLLSGSNFSQQQPSLAGRRYILNETAVKKLNWQNPLTKRMKIIEWGPVIGVVQDFHFKSLHYPVQPMALCVYPDAYEYLLVRIDGEDIPTTIGFLMERWTRLFPNIPFTYTFFDDHFGRIYQSEARLGNTLNLISVLALVIACLGLFALFSYTTGQRTKEIGIRRVLGCSTSRIVVWLTRDLVVAILLASAVAWPVTRWVMTKWLHNFAYHVDIGVSVFLTSVLFCLIVALATISFHVIQRANANPVDTLRYE